MNKQAAATAVTIAIEEMAKVISRGFRALHPKQVVSSHGEIHYLLTLDDDQPQFIIKVQTTIFSGVSRGEGEDSIRIILLNRATDRPITGKFQRVHRTTNWKDNLRSRIEDAVEEFEEMNGERLRQIKILKDLVAANAHQAFRGMLDTLVDGKYFTLTEKQLLWAEGAHKGLRQ